MSDQKNKEIEITKDFLANLLQEAEAKHAKYEEDLGHRDEDWALWYAEYLLKKIEDLGHE